MVDPHRPVLSTNTGGRVVLVIEAQGDCVPSDNQDETIATPNPKWSLARGSAKPALDDKHARPSANARI